MSVKDLLSGSIAGGCQVLIGYPFDTIKVRMQSGKYSGALECLRSTLKEGGPRVLYSGVAYPFIGSVAFNSFVFSQYTGTMARFEKMYGKKEWWHAYASGGYVGALSTVIEAPRDLLKSQSQKPNSPYRESVFSAFKQIYPKYGMRGLFQGTWATCVRNTLTTPFFFGFWDTTKDYVNAKMGTTDHPLGSALGGALGGFGIWGILYPLDVIKTRIQLDNFESDKKTYRGILDCGKKIVANQGYKGLFRGYVPCIVRAMPVNACVFLAFDYAKKLIA